MDVELRHFAHTAMATTFEVVVAGEAADYAHQAADAVFTEVDQIERALSRFIESSDVCQINHLAAGKWIRVGVHAMECLRAAARVHAETSGAFDVTIGPLMTCWRNPDKSPRQPSESELAKARALVGMNLINRDDAGQRIRVKVAGVQVDLGGIGKGYAVDRAVEVLKDWSISCAMVDAGDSSTFALGTPPNNNGWPVGVGGIGQETEPPYRVMLCDRSLSGSGTHVKGRHIMNPRTGHPAAGKIAAWAIHPSATIADALSTAFMVMTPDEVESYCRKHPEASAMLVLETPGEPKRLRFGKWNLIERADKP